MSDALLLAAALLVCFASLGWFALAKEPHWRQLRGTQPLPRARLMQLRTLGAAGLALSLALCLFADHVSQAALVWIMTLGAAAMGVTFTLSWTPRLLAPLIAWIPVESRNS